MRRIIATVALLATGFVLGTAGGEAQAWQTNHQRNLKVWKHFSVSEGEFSAKVEIEGIGVAGLRGLANFNVDQRLDRGRVVIDAVGQGVLDNKPTTIRIILVAEGEKD